MSTPEKALVTYNLPDGQVFSCQIQAVFEVEGHPYADLLVFDAAAEEPTNEIMRVVRGGDPIFQPVDGEEEEAVVLRHLLISRIAQQLVPKEPEDQIVGVWVVVDGDPRETTEFLADGTVQMVSFVGHVHMTGSWRLHKADLVVIRWHATLSPEAKDIIRQANENLADEPRDPQMRVLDETIWWFSVQGNEMTTVLLNKGRVGFYRRVPS